MLSGVVLERVLEVKDSVSCIVIKMSYNNNNQYHL